MNNTLATIRPRSAKPGMSAGPTGVSRRRYSLSAVPSLIAAWREQTRFRWELKRISQDSPHLIDDIGLTARQVEDEIAKLPFWQR